MKEYELCYIKGVPGNYTAVLYNNSHGYYTERRFMWYSKKEMIYKLRHDYNCIVKRGF